MTASTITAEQCAGLVMENIPPAMRFVRAEMRRQGAPGFSMPQFRALAFLSRNPGASLSAVADHLGVTLATASTIADRLVRHGLVERAAHPQERRRITLTLTDDGQDLLLDARTATRSKVAVMLETLSADQLRQIATGVTLLGAAFRNIPGEPKQSEIGDR
ncbi:MAG: MarR family winged helix-turn-helix transcriptional regulator [Chloroflexota bacterium]